MTIEDLSDKTKISVAVLRDIEKGKFDRYKGDEAYVKMYLKKISQALDMDSEQLTEQYIELTREIELEDLKEKEMLEEHNEEIVKKGKKIAPDTKKRDYENVPLVEDINEYFEREIKPYNPNAWIDNKKTKVGYEIPFTRYFYKYEAPEKSEDIAERIVALEDEISESLHKLFGMEVAYNEQRDEGQWC